MNPPKHARPTIAGLDAIPRLTKLCLLVALGIAIHFGSGKQAQATEFLPPDEAETESKADKPSADDPRTLRPRIELTEAALELHRQAPVIDGHNDLPWQMRQIGQSSFDKIDISQPQPKLQTDIARLRTGGIGAQFWSAYVSVDTIRSGDAAKQTFEQIDLIHRMVDRYSDVFEMADTADDVERIRRSGKIACLIGVEGGHSIENSLGVLRVFHRLGVRYMTLTHADSLDWADSATDRSISKGLAPFGIEVVREMNRLGMLVDISHVSVDTMRAAVRFSKAPVIASHSSAYSVAHHPRNVPDEILKMVQRNGGVIMVNFYSGFIVPESAAIMLDMFDRRRELREEFSDDEKLREALETWREEHPIQRGTPHDIVDHIDHIVKVAGIDHVGIGSDYDGVTSVPEQMDDVACYPYVTQELLNRGYSSEDIRKIMGDNVLRALRQAEVVARDWKD